MIALRWLYEQTIPTTRSYRLDGVFTALSSVTHFGDSVGGIEQVLRREKIIQPDGSVVGVPVISGNSWRGQLRDAGMKALLDALAVADACERAWLLMANGTPTNDAIRAVGLVERRENGRE